ncbi:FimV/HubP family polar landmark protein [Pelagibaculum spongiae]|uniref:LysM domain-containing protein n=1 Tax=Pelagibaculum spongiae TaxID=2080658 RepID=A0A2V1H1V4_9GAMM|nr:FimV/HubP family polar landmark protein [Pelagibaculum spongiae]PVZ68876.1 hypothetical protein DC094_11520 [Pelagibaculum spongiae]
MTIVRKLTLAFGWSLAVMSPGASALILGDIESTTTLNQPLTAEIPLYSVLEEDKENILVALGTQKDFSRFGIERPFFLTDLNFRLVPRGNSMVVVVSSTQDIKEPFLDFVVTIDWPGGKLSRPYTLLMDPPVFAEQRALRQQQVVAAPVSRAVSKPATVAAKPIQRSEQVQSKPTSVASVRPETYKVSAGDTLWGVARQLRPDSDVSVQQTMLALLDNNPDAFSRGNINGLKKGAVLRVPDKSEINQSSHRSAVKQIIGQNKSWQDRTTVAASQSEAPASIDRSTPVSQPQQTNEGRLSLVTPKQTDNSAATAEQGAATGDARIGELETNIAVTSEAIVAAQREGEALSDRLSVLEDQAESLESLAELKDSELAVLEQQLAAENETNANETVAVEGSEEAAQETAVTPPVVEVPVVEQPKQLEGNLVTYIDLAMELRFGELFDLLLKNPLHLLVLALPLLLILLLQMLRSRRRDEEYEPLPAMKYAKDIAPSVAAKQDDFDNLPDLDIASSVVPDLRPNNFVENNSVDSTVADDSDPTVEADIYAAYGRYDEAINVLQQALSHDSENRTLSLKLLEMFSLQEDSAAFDFQADKLLAIAPDLSAEIESLRGDTSANNADIGDFSSLPVSEASVPAMFTSRDPDQVAIDGSDLDASLSDANDENTIPEMFSEEVASDVEQDFAGLEFSESAVDLQTNPAATEELEDLEFSLDGFDMAEPEPEQQISSENDSQSIEFDIDALSGLDDLSISGLDNSVDINSDAEDSSFSLDEALDLNSLEADLDDISLQASPTLMEVPVADVDEELDDLSFLDEVDEASTKLDLARAYLEMGDASGASEILKEVLSEGDDEQKSEARELLTKASGEN